MIVVLLNVYLVILFCLVKFRIVPFNLFWKVSPILVLLILLVGLFIPMNWGAPQGPALVVRNSVAIVPSVAGEVVEVPVKANSPLRVGDVLFRIDPAPYESQVNALQAQLKLSQLRLAEKTRLQQQLPPDARSMSNNIRPRSINWRRSWWEPTGTSKKPSSVLLPMAT